MTLSPPPESQASKQAAAAAAAVAAAERKHICTRAVTALAFHPRFHALVAVGDQQGHVHIHGPTSEQRK